MSAAMSAALSEEDAARAALYALIGRLFFDASDADLLARVARHAAQADAGSPLGAAMQALAAACRDADVEAVRDEHLRLFVGVGKAQVTPYTSAYAARSLHERHLLALRQHLATLGLARQDTAADSEDHVSGLCDAMRHLITRGESEASQKAFFDEFLYVGVKAMCEQILAAGNADFFTPVANFTLALLETEREAFEMVD